MLLAVAEVVLQMIALGLERVVVFVLDLPAARPVATMAATFSSLIFQSVIQALW